MYTDKPRSSIMNHFLKSHDVVDENETTRPLRNLTYFLIIGEANNFRKSTSPDNLRRPFSVFLREGFYSFLEQRRLSKTAVIEEFTEVS